MSGISEAEKPQDFATWFMDEVNAIRENRPKAEPREPRAPWRCRHGWHAWRFKSMDNKRLLPSTGPYSQWVCTLVRICKGCGLRFTEDEARMPLSAKQLRTEYIRDRSEALSSAPPDEGESQ